jgi:hypothetical protein
VTGPAVRVVSSRLVRLARLAAALGLSLLLAVPGTAQKSHSSAKTHRVLVGGTGSIHKGGHYIRAPGASGAAKAKAPKAKKAPKSGSSSSSEPLKRDANGRIVRSEEARRAFERETGFPRGRSGYVIDHIVPLACGGADSPSNMQWQTTAEVKAKDKVERKGCSRR